MYALFICEGFNEWGGVLDYVQSVPSLHPKDVLPVVMAWIKHENVGSIGTIHANGRRDLGCNLLISALNSATASSMCGVEMDVYYGGRVREVSPMTYNRRGTDEDAYELPMLEGLDAPWIEGHDYDQD